MPVTTLCQGEGCRSRTDGAGTRRRTAEHGLLCGRCRDHLTACLGELTHLHEECGRMLGGAVPGSLRERTTGGDLPGLPFNGAAADVRARIVSVLGSWSGLVAEERGLAAPPRNVAALTAFLLRHADWLAGHSAAGEASEEIARLVRTGRRAAFPAPVTRAVRLGACPEAACTGALAFAHPERPGGAERTRSRERSGGPEVACDADPGHRWTSDRWSELSHLMETGREPGAGAATERWLTAADIARLWHVPVGTVYRLASEERWRRRHRAGRAYYAETDVRACFTRRAARR